MDASYLYGGGINIDWKTFWDYKTIQARAVHAWLQDMFVQARGVSYYRDKLSDEAQLHVIAAWAISQAPLALQQGMNDVLTAIQQGFQPDDCMGAAEERAVAFLRSGIQHILEGLQIRRKSTNPFTIDHNWDTPTDHKQR